MAKFGIYVWFGGHVDNDTRFKAIKDSGFDSVAILYSDEYKDSIGNKESHIELAAKYNLKIENYHLPYTNAFDIFQDDDNKANAQLNLYKDGIISASKNNVPVVVIHLTGDKITYPINPKGIDRIKELVDFAKCYKVKLAFENLRKEGLEYLYKVLDTFNDEYVGLCYDYGHDHCFNKEHEFEVLRKYGNRLLALHLHGNDGLWDYHRRLRDGNGDLKELKKELDKVHVTCPYSLEVIQNVPANTYEELMEYIKTMKEDLEKLV